MKSVFPVFVILMFGQWAFAAPKSDSEVGVLFSATVRANFPGKNTTMKGLVITLDPDRRAYVCYDTDLMRLSIAWTGEFLKFGNYLREIVHPQPPEVAGTPAFGLQPGPGWARDGKFTDPRIRQQGPLPDEWAKYQGLYRHGKRVVLSYKVNDASVLELPGIEGDAEAPIFTRTFQIEKSSAQTLALADVEGQADFKDGILTIESGATNDQTKCVAIAVKGGGDAQLEHKGGRVLLHLPASDKTRRFKVGVYAGLKAGAGKLSTLTRSTEELTDLNQLTKGGPANWGEVLTTQGVQSTNKGPYVVDTLTEPVPNPWNTRTFFGGFDFFPDGRAAICSFHGDVWIVSGIEGNLSKLQWKRFAAGLFQPLGLKIIEGKIYVTGRDQITQLHDLNGDGEADYYENFNNDSVVTPNYHEFTMDLQADSKGNLYVAKGAPWTPNVESPHQGAVLKISKDGNTMEVYATGLRAPNGMGMGPNDELTVSDNQGHWMPSSKLNLVKKGGFYGMTPAAQKEIQFQRNGSNFVANPSDPAVRSAHKLAPFDAGALIPASYDQPIAWLPMNMDNSSGGQVWVTSDKWGPLKDHMLFTSYGRGTMFLVLMEEIEGTTQAAMVRFPFRFPTGVMRGRVNPKDGQVYLCGLRGWQTDGNRDGGFYRVRYTEEPVHMPVEMHSTTQGIEIRFASPLDEAAAKDLGNWSLEQWNYVYTGSYGSPDLSASDPKQKGHDKVEIKSIQVSSDKRTVMLEIPGIKPVMQMKIKYGIKASDGESLNQEIYSTIHKLGAPRSFAASR